jgi:hypothetical protein
MNLQETTQVVFGIKAVYPAHFQRYSKTDFDGMISAWSGVFANIPFEVVKYGVNAFIANDTKGFPPVPGQIMQYIQLAKHGEKLSEGEAWSLVLKAVQNSLYNSDEEFQKLPQDVQRAVGSPQALRAMAMEEGTTVIQSNFLRSYRGVTKQAEMLLTGGEDEKRLTDGKEMLLLR